MNFLPIRDNIYNWTLQTDQQVFFFPMQLFNEVSKMVQYIFEAQKNIGLNISATKTTLTESSVMINNNFNHFLKLSESKFTENKIQDKRQINQQVSSKIEEECVQKSKMDIFKDALNISIKNLQIKENQNQNDNVSVSEYSLSQAVFKNARLPPYFGSKQFRAKKYLDLFYDEDLIQSQSRIHTQSFSNLPLSSPSQPNSNNLAPPPSLDALNLSNIPSLSNNILPPPPLMNNLPPPPPLLNNLPPPPPLLSNLLPSPPSIGNLNIPTLSAASNLPSIQSQRQQNNLSTFNNNQNQLRNSSYQKNTQQRNDFSNQGSQVVKNRQNIKVVRALTLQQQLALKLKHGKNYKVPVLSQQVIIPQKKKNQTKQLKSNQILANQIIESTRPVRQSYRESSSLDSFLSQNTKPFSKQQTYQSETFQQEQQNSLFAASKNKNKVVIPVAQKIAQKKEADMLMSRSTFNQDLLFKKKPVVSPITKKVEQKKTALFNNSDQEEDIFAKNKKQKKTEVNILQKKKPQKKAQSKVNKLFANDDEQDQDIFNISKRKKTQSKITKKQTAEQKKQEIKEVKKVQKKKNLFEQEDEDDLLSTFKKSPKKEKVVIKQSQVKKQLKNPLISVIQQQDEPVSKVQKANEKTIISSQIHINQINTDTEKNQHKNQENQDSKLQVLTEQQKKKKRIAAMGGFGIGPIMPKGMIITKPSQAKQQQKKAIQRQEEEHRKVKAQHHSDIINQKQLIKQIKQDQLKIKQEPVQIKQQPVLIKQEKEQIKQEKVQIKQPQLTKNIIKQVQQKQKNKPNQIIANIQQETKSSLQPENETKVDDVKLQLGRRKKGKPRKLLFDDEQKQVKPFVVTQIQTKTDKKHIPQQQTKISVNKIQIKQKVQEQILNEDDQQQLKRKRIQKIAKMGGMGMMGMGMMNPLMSQGIKITKPSQARMQQKLALQKIAQQQQNKKIKQQQNKHKIQQENNKQRAIQQQRRAEKLREQKQKVNQQQQIRQKMLIQHQNKLRQEKQKQLQKQSEEIDRKNQLLRKEQRQRQQKQQKRIQQEIRLEKQRQNRLLRDKLQQQQKRKAEQQSKKKKVGLPIFNLANDKSNQKTKTQIKKDQSFAPKLPPKTNPMGVPLLNPLGNNSTSSKLAPPLSLPIKSTSNNLPSIQSLSSQNKPKATKKGGLFDQNQNQDNDFSIKKKSPLQKKTAAKKGGLFDQDDDEDANFGFKQKKKDQAKQKIGQNQSKKKPTLFGNQKDDQIILPKKQQTQKVQIQQKNIIPVSNNSVLNKNNTKKKGLFNESDEEQPFSVKSKAKIGTQTSKINSPMKAPEINIKKQEQTIVTKPLLKSPIQAPVVKKIQTPLLAKKSINPLGNAQKKKTLFDSDEQQPVAKTQQKPELIMKKQPIIESTNQPKKKTLLDQSDQDSPQKLNQKKQAVQIRKVQQPASKNKKNLFDSDSSEDEQALRKKRQATRKLKKLI